MTKSRGILPPRQSWTDEQIAIVTRLYPDTPTAQIAKQLGVSANLVYSKASSLGLKKSAAYLASPAACRLRRGDNVGAAYRFKPGQKVWNKGMKGLNIGGKETQFKPGHRGGKALELYKPIGSERLSKEGYIQRKVNDDMPFQNRWRGVHILVWEEVNGPLPPGHAIAFKDRNKLNTDISNLELITRQELMRRNTIHRYPPELKGAIRHAAKVRRKIRERDEQSGHN